MTTLKTAKRSMDVKAKKLRREGFVPGNLCGRDLEESVPLKIQVFDAQKFIKKNMIGSRTVLELDGKKINALVKDYEYNPVTKHIMYIDFQTLVAGEKISAKAQIVLLHEDLADGCVDEELSEIDYKAEPENLIEKVELDFEKLGKVKCVHVKDIPEFCSDKIDLITSPDAIVFTVEEASAPIEDTEEDEIGRAHV